MEIADLDADDYTTLSIGSCAEVPASFSENVIPIFSEQGCTNGSCHGNGFESGTLNLDASLSGGISAVHEEILEGRIDEENPSSSLILIKPLGLENHGGEERFSGLEDPNYITIFCWIEAGFPND